MITKYLKIIIIFFLISIIIFFGYKNYLKFSDSELSPLILVPINAAFVLKVNNMEKFNKRLTESKIFQQSKHLNYINELHSNINIIDSIIKILNKTLRLQIKTIFFSTHRSTYNNAAVLFSANPGKKINLKNVLSKILKLDTKEYPSYIYEKANIYKLEINSKSYFLSEKGGIFFGSSSKLLVQDAIRQYGSETNLLKNNAFIKVKATINGNAPANLYYNFNNLFSLLDIYTKEKQTKNLFLENFSDWTATDIFIKDNSFFANGLSFPAYDNSQFLRTLKNQKVTNNDICDIIPHNTSLVFETGLINAKLFFDNKNIFLQKHNAFYEWEKRKRYLEENYNFDLNEFLKYVDNEVGIFYISAENNNSFEQKFSFIESRDIQQSSIFLSGLINTKTKIEYDEFKIFNIAEPNLVSFIFGDIFLIENNPYFVVIDDYLVFGNSIAALEYVIDNFKSNNVLSTSKHFKEFAKQISDKSNIFFYLNPGESFNSLASTLNKQWRELLTFNEDSLRNFTGFVFQLNVGTPLFLNNITLFYDKNYKEELKQEWYAKLDTTFAIKPQIIYDYISKKEQVFVQDNSNKIYLFSSDGKKLWEKQIDEKIKGGISQIDFYKNKKLQILFNTENQLYLIDRLGRFVEDYPKNLDFKSTNQHALFDYKNDRNYRIIIAAKDGMLYNYDKKGIQVKGWKYKAIQNIIHDKLQYFTKNSKDYILCPSKDKNLSLLARNGSRRVIYNTDASFTKNPLQLDHHGTLYGITNDEKLWRGTLDGNSTEIFLTNLTNDSKFIINNIDTKTEQEFVYTNDKKVFIVDEEFDLLHSFEVADIIKEIFTFNGNLVVLTDIELYVWKDGEMKDGTPIVTDGFAEVSDIDNDGKLNLIISRDTFIFNFEI